MKEYKSFFLNPGGVFVSNEPYYVHTILGSCVSVCLWDEKNKISAVNHYILSHCNGINLTCKYGNISLRYMLFEIYKLGASSLSAYVIGGSSNPLLNDTIPTQNIKIADEFLEKHRIPVCFRDVGGFMGRKITFDTMSGEISIVKGSELEE